MRDAGLEVSPDLVMVGDALSEGEGARLTAAMLDGGSGTPTAIATANDLLALGCLDEFIADYARGSAVVPAALVAERRDLRLAGRS